MWSLNYSFWFSSRRFSSWTELRGPPYLKISIWVLNNLKFPIIIVFLLRFIEIFAYSIFLSFIIRGGWEIKCISLCGIIITFPDGFIFRSLLLEIDFNVPLVCLILLVHQVLHTPSKMVQKRLGPVTCWVL